jgi:hypothetical protein
MGMNEINVPVGLPTPAGYDGKTLLIILKLYNLPNVTRFYLRSVSRIRQAKAKNPSVAHDSTAKSRSFGGSWMRESEPQEQSPAGYAGNP